MPLTHPHLAAGLVEQLSGTVWTMWLSFKRVGPLLSSSPHNLITKVRLSHLNARGGHPGADHGRLVVGVAFYTPRGGRAAAAGMGSVVSTAIVPAFLWMNGTFTFHIDMPVCDM